MSPPSRYDPAVVELLRGTLNDAPHPLHKLRGNALVLQRVADDVERWHDAHIRADPHAFHRMSTGSHYFGLVDDSVRLPQPASDDIDVNMMPIRLFDPERTVPDFLRQYVPLIERCARQVPRFRTVEPGAPFHVGVETELAHDRVAYLTVHESAVPPGQAQRRPGLHVERPGASLHPGRLVTDLRSEEYWNLAWGLGNWRHDGFPVDGIYMASSVAGSCRVWPALVEPLLTDTYTDAHGGMEHARAALCRRAGPGVLLDAHELVWITDRTPHESLPLPFPPLSSAAADGGGGVGVGGRGGAAQRRQFFRLVVGRISAWYSRHNTPNPLGTVAPDAPVIDVDKFAPLRPPATGIDTGSLGLFRRCVLQ
jgi:hypothetical protein